MKHQHKVDPEGKLAAANPEGKLAAAKVAEARVHCEACNASFKSIQHLKRHEQTMKHQHKVDPEGKLATRDEKQQGKPNSRLEMRKKQQGKPVTKKQQGKTVTRRSTD